MQRDEFVEVVLELLVVQLNRLVGHRYLVQRVESMGGLLYHVLRLQEIEDCR